MFLLGLFIDDQIPISDIGHLHAGLKAIRRMETGTRSHVTTIASFISEGGRTINKREDNQYK